LAGPPLDPLGRALRAVHGVARAAQGAYEERDLLRRICVSVAETFGFERTAISRYLPDGERLEAVAAHGVELEELARLPSGMEDWPLLRRAAEGFRAVFVEDARRDAIVPAEFAEGFGLHSALAVPLFSGGRCLGFLGADRGGAPFALTPDELEVLETIGVIAASFLERAMVHDELRRIDELKSNFIALASHELRTPASVIFGIASTLHMRSDELREDQLQELRQALYEQGKRMRDIVDQLLDLSRLEARSIKIEPQPLRVRARVEEIVLLVAQERVPDVRIDIEPELEAVVDPHALDRVVSNLVANAFRYGEAPITIAAEQRDRHFRLAVEDRGRGVPDEFVPHLFERFARRDASREERSGAGLGLSIAQSYAQAHGGDLLYEPARPRGARFELVLPTGG
jgi:signal transduction histidine kinase